MGNDPIICVQIPLSLANTIANDPWNWNYKDKEVFLRALHDAIDDYNADDDD